MSWVSTVRWRHGIAGALAAASTVGAGINSLPLKDSLREGVRLWVVLICGSLVAVLLGIGILWLVQVAQERGLID